MKVIDNLFNSRLKLKDQGSDIMQTLVQIVMSSFYAENERLFVKIIQRNINVNRNIA